MQKYIPSQLESKWQQKWADHNLYKVDLSQPKEKYYILVEFTYPSGDLHMGHWFTFTAPDILARARRMQGYNVFFPNGFDAFGLPAENAAIKRGIHPQDWTLSNIERMKEQFATMGASFDWEHEVITCLPIYYKWNQWIFLQMLDKGLAYKGRLLSNWCPNCQTVLANENVEAGKCWRCGTEVIQKEVEQWFFKITEYSDKLLWPDSPSVDWPKPVREGQNNWIGKSEGMEIDFPLETQSENEHITVFTKFPETIFGVTYMVIAPEYPLVNELTTADHKSEVDKYIKDAQNKSELERTSLEKEKTGVFTGFYCINPVNGQRIPLWISDYVIGNYGTGAVMGVPGSDHRDFAFAKKYNLPIIRVIGESANDQSEVESDKGVLEVGWIVNSGQFNGLQTPTPARETIKDWLAEKGYGRRKTQYHLHDWSVSRQRYWGTPIPIIYCDNCGTVPVPEKDLPVELPYKVDYAPKGKPPLATAEDWVNVPCPECGKAARREVETMDTFVDSSWYFLRYLDPKNEEKIFDAEIVKNWMPLDIYFGGAEHTLGHTLYSRFFTKFLHDIGVISFDEYAKRRVHHGLILGPDGQKMSKSKGNVINPDDEVKQYGADAVRLFLSFLGPYDIVAPWSTTGVNGVYHFLQRVWSLFEKVDQGNSDLSSEDLKIMHKTIKKVTEDISDIKLNTAIASLMEWLNYLSKKEKIQVGEYRTYLILLAPFAPHITEELWQMLHHAGPVSEVSSGASSLTSFTAASPEDTSSLPPANIWSIHQQSWPEFDKDLLVSDKVEVIVQVNGKVRDIIVIEKDILSDKEVIEKMAIASEKVQKFTQDNPVKKIIYVPGKVINLVV